MTRLSPSALGAIVGVLVGLVWIWLGVKLFLLIFLAGLGFAIGKLFESEELRERVRELFSFFYR
ncbi:hypothetical protein HRbin07_00188 [bacterium HR07]|uniref:Small integral membrane protein n=1 Tax=Acetithermum autotrophicum TaxID=1446466 RepID=H5SRF4_ACEAU|nr:hypothetical protein HGMM_OP2C219 [Candidatus Acetothermum autotrophicum]GBC75995.1 hypothetical protein HRbin07_00188 [bacterium HR07]